MSIGETNGLQPCGFEDELDGTKPEHDHHGRFAADAHGVKEHAWLWNSLQ